MIYQWQEGRSHKADAQQIGELVEQVSKELGGHETAPALVDAARDPESPAHGLFEWQDSVAGEMWRIHQARRVIGSLRVEVVNQEGVTTLAPAFYHVRVVEHGEVHEGYRPQLEVLANHDMREQALREALRYLEGFRRRYQQIVELSPVFAAVDEVIEAINGQLEGE